MNPEDGSVSIVVNVSEDYMQDFLACLEELKVPLK